MRHVATVLCLGLCACRPGLMTPAAADDSTLHSASGIAGKSYDQMVSDLRDFSAKHAALTEVVEFGKSAEGRPLLVLKVQDKSVTATGKRPVVLISEGIHADEYLNITDRLPAEFLDNNGSTNMMRFLAKGGVVYMVPMLNPDGYERRQRDNAQNVDLNRDFVIRAANNQGFTAPETRAISAYVAAEARASSLSLEVSMEYHCCVGGFIYPWAYTSSPLPADALQRHRDVGTMVQSVFGYPSGTVREIAGYPAVGGSDDYYLENYGRRAFSFEGRQGTEAQNLPKHVQMWNKLFDLAGKDYADGVPATSGSTTPGLDAYLAIQSEGADGSLQLFGSAPATYDGLEVCLGSAAECLVSGGSARHVAATFVSASGGRRIYRIQAPVQAQDGGVLTLLATSGGAASSSSPTRTVKLVRK